MNKTTEYLDGLPHMIQFSDDGHSIAFTFDDTGHLIIESTYQEHTGYWRQGLTLFPDNIKQLKKFLERHNG